MILNVSVGVRKPLNDSRSFIFCGKHFLMHLVLLVTQCFTKDIFYISYIQSPTICTSYSNCISCQVFNIGKKKVCDNCANLNIKLVNQTIEQCVVPVDENCFIIFSYETDDFFNNITFRVLNEKRKYQIFLYKHLYARNQAFRRRDQNCKMCGKIQR